jgi:hypothetical protein
MAKTTSSRSPPFDQLGQPLEIVQKAFGDWKGYDESLQELETLYKNQDDQIKDKIFDRMAHVGYGICRR